jgi:hypothetical protein
VDGEKEVGVELSMTITCRSFFGFLLVRGYLGIGSFAGIAGMVSDLALDDHFLRVLLYFPMTSDPSVKLNFTLQLPLDGIDIEP